MKIRILSYNIHKGFGAGKKRFILDHIRQAIRSLDADLVFLQEVIGTNLKFKTKFAKWPDSSQFEYLAHEVWPHHAYGKNAVYDEGHHGNAVLSRFPIKRFENIDLSVGPGERRGLLHCSVTEPSTGIEFNCFCTHLGLISQYRAEQCVRMCETVAEKTESIQSAVERPLVIAGDFNDWERKACNVLENRLRVHDVGRAAFGRVQRTYPSFFPLFALDRIYTRGFTVRNVMVLRGRPWNRLSDHAPLYAELELMK